MSTDEITEYLVALLLLPLLHATIPVIMSFSLRVGNPTLRMECLLVIKKLSHKQISTHSL